MEVAACTLGHLVRSGGALTADIVETEVRHSARKVWPEGFALASELHGFSQKLTGAHMCLCMHNDIRPQGAQAVTCKAGTP